MLLESLSRTPDPYSCDSPSPQIISACPGGELEYSSGIYIHYFNVALNLHQLHVQALGTQCWLLVLVLVLLLLVE